MKKVFLVIVFIIVGNTHVSVQGTDNYNVDLPRMPYLSPEAASLGKYGEIPVSEYTMVSQIFSDINNQQPKAKRKERNIIDTKIGRMKYAERKRKGEEHSRGNKR